MVIYGTKLLGTVDSSNGTQQATLFFHLYFLPIAPLGSFELRGNGQGRPVPLNLQSVLLGYGRVWGFVAVAGLIAATYLALETGWLAGGLVAFATLAAATLWALSILKCGVRKRLSGLAHAATIGLPALALIIAVGAGVNERLARMRSEPSTSPSVALSPELINSLEQASAKSKVDKHREPCARGDGERCAMLGTALKTAGDTAGAMQAFTKGCELGFPRACFNQGLLLLDTNPAAGGAILTKTCDLGYAAGCWTLAKTLAKTLEQTAPEKALRLNERGCELNDGVSCRHVARMTASGVGTKKNAKRARQLFAQACQLGDTTSCGAH